MASTAPDKEPSQVKDDIAKRRYNRNAWFFDFQHSIFGRMMDDGKKKLIATAKGRVLEIGVGTGSSLALYPEGVELVGVDISPNMLARAEAKSDSFQGQLTLQVGDVQNLDFPDDSFDMVITSCVFCSVTDPIKGFQEVNRVLKPDGIGLHLEHVKSKMPIIGTLMDILNPIVVRMMGANINRDTAENIRKSGLRTVEEKDQWLDIVKLFTVTKG